MGRLTDVARSSTTPSRRRSAASRPPEIGSASGVWANNIGGGWDCLPGHHVRRQRRQEVRAPATSRSARRSRARRRRARAAHDAGRLDRPGAVTTSALSAGSTAIDAGDAAHAPGDRPSRLRGATAVPTRARTSTAPSARRRDAGRGREPAQRLAARRALEAAQGAPADEDDLPRPAARLPGLDQAAAAARPPGHGDRAAAQGRPDPALAQAHARQAPQGRADPSRGLPSGSLSRPRAGDGRDRKAFGARAAQAARALIRAAPEPIRTSRTSALERRRRR